MRKRVLSVFLCLALIITLLPATSSVVLADEVNPTQTQAIGGQCGDNVYWAYDAAKNVLTISGTGSMYTSYNNSSNLTPWASSDKVPNYVSKVVFEEGITLISSYFGYNMRFGEVVFPRKSLKTIGMYAFEGCFDGTKPCSKTIKIPDSVTVIGQNAFAHCEGTNGDSVVTSIKLPKHINFTRVREALLYNDYQIAEVVVPYYVTRIDAYAFGGCKKLKDIYIGPNVSKIDASAFYELSDFTIHYAKGIADWANIEGVSSLAIEGGYTFKFNDTSRYNDLGTYMDPSHVHTVTKVNQVDSTCSAAGTKAYYECKACVSYFEDANGEHEIYDFDAWKNGAGKIEKKAHDLETVTTPATDSKDGSIQIKCKKCTYVKQNTVIKAASNISISATSFVYDGKEKNPTVTVKDSTGVLVSNSNYNVTYSTGCKNVGDYSVKITFNGEKYTGSKTVDFTILPKSTSIGKVTASSKGFKLVWTKQAKETSGYELQYSTSISFKSGVKVIKVKKNTTTSTTIKKLKAKTKYYVRIRTYKVVGKKTFYSGWSKVKNVTTKK